MNNKYRTKSQVVAACTDRKKISKNFHKNQLLQGDPIVDEFMLGLVCYFFYYQYMLPLLVKRGKADKKNEIYQFSQCENSK